MNPYQALPPVAFWRTAVAERDAFSISGLWQPRYPLTRDDRVLTAGSCFAQHISRAMVSAGISWLDTEPAPAWLPRSEHAANHYGVFSFRTGNLYTVGGFLQWLRWAFGEAPMPEEAWEEQGRWYDPFRPAILPDGYASQSMLQQGRETTLRAIRDGVQQATLLVFTLGLTEAWRHRQHGYVYPMCPGTLHGRFDAQLHEFHNYRFAEILQDMQQLLQLLKIHNPALRLLLTVSPVPLTATASGKHVLCATTQSKSVLRAVAGELADTHEHVDYFPSYEIITSHPFKGMFFDPNLRTVCPHGVDQVMRHFWQAQDMFPAATLPVSESISKDADVQCEEVVLAYHQQA